MAAPLVAECTALVREYNIKDRESMNQVQHCLKQSNKQYKMDKRSRFHSSYNRLPKYHQRFGFIYLWLDTSYNYDDIGKFFICISTTVLNSYINS